jgi:hypothetical protein
MIAGTSDPNLIVASCGMALLAVVGGWRMFLWLRSLPMSPDPWGTEVDQQMEQAAEACSHCSMPQPPDAWFCAHCAHPVGPYHSFTPYVFQFSDGLHGTVDPAGAFRPSPLVVIGYLLLSPRLGIFAPLYCVALVLRLFAAERGSKVNSEDPILPR